MTAWADFGGEQHKQDLLRRTVEATHADITPPWETEELE